MNQLKTFVTISQKKKMRTSCEKPLEDLRIDNSYESVVDQEVIG